MASSNYYQGSIAQNNISFSILEQINTVVGSNFFNPQIYIGSATSAANIVTPAGANTITFVNSSNFASLTQGTLLNWLTGFFASNVLSQVGVVEYDSTASLYAGMTTAFNSFHALGYFKLSFDDGTNGAAQIALAALCSADKPLSQFWIGSADTNDTANPLTTGMAYWLNTASPVAPYRMVYSAQTGINPALSQLGLSLGTINGSGTPMGNPLEYVSTTNVLASGTTGGTDDSNLSPTLAANLAANNIAYYATVGAGSPAVALIGGVNSLGGANVVDAFWMEAYINFLCQNQVAQLLTTPGAPTFKTSQTYQSILAILSSQLQPFVSIGRLSNLKISKTAFQNLPATSGSNITIPNAWSATFNLVTTTVTVQGTLSITAP